MIKPSEMLQGVHSIMRLLESSNEAVCNKYGLTQYEASVLLYLYNNPEKNTASDIVDYRRLPKANVSKAVELLINKNLLTREQDSRDRRRIHLKLTQSAGSIITDLTAAMDVFFSMLFSDFTKEELEVGIEMINRIARNAERGLSNR